MTLTYSRDPNIDGWETEFALLEKTNSNAPIRFFAYFGHEITEQGETGYSAAYPNRIFDQDQFIHGLTSLTGKEGLSNKHFSNIPDSTFPVSSEANLKSLADSISHQSFLKLVDNRRYRC